MSKRSLLLINPNSRRGSVTRQQVIHQLQELGFDLVEESVDKPEYFSDLIRRYHQEIDLVIIGGGDGTINSALEGLIETNLPLGILPLGTANNLARTLHIPQSLSEACQIIAQGKIHAIDLGWVNGKYFLNVAGLGLSTEINRRVSRKLKRFYGVFAYIATALQVIGEVRPFWAEIKCEDRLIKVKTLQITICNGRYYGSGLVIAEDATIDDQRLDLYSIEAAQWWKMLPLLPSAIAGKGFKGKGVFTVQGKEIELSTLTPYEIDIDGDPGTITPARFKVIPQALPVFVPASFL